MIGKMKEKTKIIDEFYGRDLVPEDLEKYYFLNLFMSKEDVSLAPNPIFFRYRKELENHNISKQELSKALNCLNTESFIKVIDQIFKRAKHYKDDGTALPKIIKLAWFWLFYRWPYVEDRVKQASPTSHLKFYIISTECLSVSPITELFSVPSKDALQTLLLSHITYLSPQISRNALEKESGVNRAVINRKKIETDELVALLQKSKQNKQESLNQIEALKDQISKY